MKRVLTVVLCVFLLCSVPAKATAPNIVDGADLLTPQQLSALEEKAQALSDTYQMDIVILTVYGLEGKADKSYADDYFDYNGYGIGDDRSGILLLLSTEYRDWAISTCGKAIDALPDHSVQAVFSSISGYLSQDSWYPAFDAYLDALEPYLNAYASDSTPASYSMKHFLIALAIGLAVAAITLFIMIRGMNTARHQHGAASYIKENTYSLNIQKDLFLYSQLRKVRRSENNSSSSGRSHGGGHGKF